MLRIDKFSLNLRSTTVNALCFIPVSTIDRKQAAIFCHGYTSHKGSILNWGTRLSEIGITTILFDLPGHYLGSFNEVPSFEEFKADASQLFVKSFNSINERYDLKVSNSSPLILGGHSLGALLSLKALNSPTFANINTLNILVGLGLLPVNQIHIFQTPFYKSVLEIRKELVSPTIAPDIIFPWIQQEKQQLSLKNQSLHFITGENDIVVGANGTELLIEDFKEDNNISFDKARNLPHHMPEMAASHIKKYLKKIQIL